MSAALPSGLLYAAVVFAAGFLLGTLRVLVVGPTVGETAAVLIELPIILAVSWIVCRWVVQRLEVPGDVTARLAMGAVALVALLLAEAAISLTLFGRTFAEFLATYRTTSGQTGLAGQIAFALFPWLQARLAARS